MSAAFARHRLAWLRLHAANPLALEQLAAQDLLDMYAVLSPPPVTLEAFTAGLPVEDPFAPPADPEDEKRINDAAFAAIPLGPRPPLPQPPTGG